MTATPMSNPSPSSQGEVERPTGETLEQYADRIVQAVRRGFMDRLDDDVIGKLGQGHLIFGKACAMEAIGNAMREAAASRPAASGEEVERVARALAAADSALRNHACHGGPDVPCLRSKEQCRADCGREAGNALLLVTDARAAIAALSSPDGLREALEDLREISDELDRHARLAEIEAGGSCDEGAFDGAAQHADLFRRTASALRRLLSASKGVTNERSG